MSETAVVYVHGKGGSAEESERYRSLFPDCDVFGPDYSVTLPWETEEINRAIGEIKKKYKKIVLIANSIGAFFAMHADIERYVDRAYFISPIVDMEGLIKGMMAAAKVTEEELCEKGTITTTSGTLSWGYLTYVRTHPIRWTVKTEILCGSGDRLTPTATTARFAAKHGAGLTVMEGGEHWFHTEEQTTFLDDWIKNHEVNNG